MGLTSGSTGIKAVDKGIKIKKENDNDRIIALAGNPNVGKSSVFNLITGLRQHTGNWPGKTVSSAIGKCVYNNRNYIFVDIPGTYSLMPHSKEEEVARDYICFGESDAVVVVCDATCFERNLNLVLQCIEITDNVIICLNLMDEAKKKNIHIDTKKISEFLGVSVVKTSAKEGKGLKNLMNEIEKLTCEKKKNKTFHIKYLDYIEEAIEKILPLIDKKKNKNCHIKSRWIALKMLEGDEDFLEALKENTGIDLKNDLEIKEKIEENKIDRKKLKEDISKSVCLNAEFICANNVSKKEARAEKLDKIVTGKITGKLFMIALLAIVFYLTISGANYVSDWLSKLMFYIEEKLLFVLTWIKTPKIICDILISGVFRVTGWVVSVMLPPMAIFFPLFTLLEDYGYLPRVAFNMDKTFKKCNTCGKQALTMCMGFGCNAAGIVGCRIIDSPRERLIAIITNSFVPCNGKFPTIIAIIAMFFTFSIKGPFKSAAGAIVLTLVVLLGVWVTFLISKILSETLLKGEESSFILEMPPYRTPKIGSVLVRSMLDRGLFVLGRAIAVAAPAGAVIWLISNAYFNGVSVLQLAVKALNPIANLIGMDGVILLSFILAWPANELVIPIMIMTYTASASIGESMGYEALRNLLIANGWTWVTAVNVILFSLMHWPCSTSILTVKKESGSKKWTFLAFIIPTLSGVLACLMFTLISKIFV